MTNYIHSLWRESLLDARLWANLFAFGSLLSFIWAISFTGMNHDEVEHFHVAFKMTQGELPYRDFPQNHFPLFWLTLVPWVELFPFSINGIIAARWVNLGLLVISFLSARRMLPFFTPWPQRIAEALLFGCMALVGLLLEWHLVRPDAYIGTLSIAGIALLLKPQASLLRSMTIGLIWGIGLAFSPKMFPVLGVFMIVCCLEFYAQRDFKPMLRILALVLGLLIPLSAMFAWVVSVGALLPFWEFTIELNRSFSASHGFGRFHYVKLYPVFVAILGAFIIFHQCRKSEEAQRRGILLVTSCLFLGLAGTQLATHSYTYNLQFITPVIAISILAFHSMVTNGLSRKVHHVAIGLLLFGQFFLTLGFPVFRYGALGAQIKQKDLKSLIEYAKPGGKTCVAFAPHHPIFCKDASKLMLGWDYIFAEELKKGKIKSRYIDMWNETFEKILEVEPDIVLPNALSEESLLKRGYVRTDLTEPLRKLREKYKAVKVGGFEVLLNSERFSSEIPESGKRPLTIKFLF